MIIIFHTKYDKNFVTMSVLNIYKRYNYVFMFEKKPQI